MDFTEIKSNDVPLRLLLEADPSEKSISSYLEGSWCFAAVENSEIIGACVVKLKSHNVAEIYNISITPNHQGRGIGSELMRYTLAELRFKNVKKVELGTGTFGYQLSYYQRMGFRVDSVAKDHFLLNYPDPIFENGIQHKDMLRLYLNLE